MPRLFACGKAPAISAAPFQPRSGRRSTAFAT
jgi:hypothetical protein